LLIGYFSMPWTAPEVLVLDGAVLILESLFIRLQMHSADSMLPLHQALN
jgi:hypothetical protein